jgi:hypothetical protein
MKSNVSSETLDVSQLASGRKGRHILLESILWAMELMKPQDRSQRRPHI